MLYFAYGSNLSKQNRIKNNINITKVKNYKLEGYRICFRDPYGDPDLEKTSQGFVMKKTIQIHLAINGISSEKFN